MELVNDVGIIVAEWICSPPTTDLYSTPDMQKFIQSAITFLRSIKSHTEALDGREIAASGSPTHHTGQAAWRCKQQALAPLMTAINPLWRADNRWEVHNALHIAETLSDKKGGHSASQDDRTVIAQDRLIEVWWERTTKKPSLGTTNPAAPDPFYTALLADLEVSKPRTMFTTDREVFDRSEVDAFFREVIAKGGIRLAIKRAAGRS